MNKIDEIALRVNRSMDKRDALGNFEDFCVRYASALLAELSKDAEPVGYRYVDHNGHWCFNEMKFGDIAEPVFTHPAPVIASEQKPVNYVHGDWFKAKTIDEMQAFFMSRLADIRSAARAHGYAIGLHGSTRRDFDLMAMPWRDGYSDKETLAHAIAQAACGIDLNGNYCWENKGNGRFAVSMCICWTDHSNPEFKDLLSIGHIDLSVVESSPPNTADIEQRVGRLDCPTCWEDGYKQGKRDAVPEGMANFACYLIDHCENETIGEEFIQSALHKALQLPQYAETAAAPKQEK